jgi:probable rRNA maturation factor
MRSKIEWHGKEDFWPGSKEQRSRWLSEIANAKGFAIKEIHYHATDDLFLLGLNKEHLAHDTLTDIITFDYSNKKQLSGEIYISWERVAENADDMGIRQDEEALRVTAHGLLHMMGERDKSESDKKKMRKAEENALVSWTMFHVEHG